MNTEEKKKLFERIFQKSYITNKNGKLIFSFPDFRKNAEKENFKEKDFYEISKFLKPAFLEAMSVKEFAQWVWSPTKESFEAEDFLMSSYKGRESFDSSLQSKLPPFIN